MTPRYSVYSVTDIGPKRKRNEDSILADEAAGVFVVADGMGGHAGGDVASKIAARVVRDQVVAQQRTFEALAKSDEPETRALACRAMEAAIQSACEAIFNGGIADPALSGMGTTCDAVAVCGRLAVIGHVGDGRVQQLREGQFAQLTEDHSMVAAQIKAGIITPEQAKTVAYRSVVLRALGAQASVEVDTLVVECVSGDVLMLSSDGLHGVAAPEAIAAELARPDAGVGQRLLDLALRSKTTDNVSAVLVHFLPAVKTPAEVLTTVKVTALRSVPLFALLEYRELQAVIQIAHVENHAANTVLFREGEPGSDFYVIVAGRMSVESAGKKLADLAVGKTFGEMGLVEDAPRSATVRALDASSVLRFKREDLYGLMRRELSLGMKLSWSLLQSLSEKLRATSASYAKAPAGSPAMLPFAIKR